MEWTQLAIPGVWTFAPEPVADDRGFFARLLDTADLRARGLIDTFPQQSIAHNTSAGTIRGLHLQRAPALETKIVRCTRGAAYDVIVDLRPESPAFGTYVAVLLDDQKHTSVYIPAGCAHGYQTLVDGTALHYAISTAYVADLAAGVRFDDADLAIPWPLAVTAVSARDRALPTLAHYHARPAEFVVNSIGAQHA